MNAISFMSCTPPEIITCNKPSSLDIFLNDLQTPGGIDIVSNSSSINSSEPSSFQDIKNLPFKTVKVS